LEQYCIDALSAVEIIFFAGFEFNDIKSKLIFDLGSGTGRLSIASALLNAKYVISVDVDWNPLKILIKNIKNLGLENIIFPICSEINNFEFSKSHLPSNLEITTIMNPPFGVQKRTADRVFLKKAFSYSDIIYSIHLNNEKVDKFVNNYAKRFNWNIDYAIPFNLTLEKSFPFHTQKTKRINVKIFRFLKQPK